MLNEGYPVHLEMYVFRKENGTEACPFETWYQSLDKSIRVRIATRLERLKSGNFGDHRWLETGLLELRFSAGAGYRIYCGDAGQPDEQQWIILLVAGDKSTQEKDIPIARQYW